MIGGRTADAIVDTALSKLKSLVQDRLKGRGGSSGRSGGSGGKVKFVKKNKTKHIYLLAVKHKRK